MAKPFPALLVTASVVTFGLTWSALLPPEDPAGAGSAAVLSGARRVEVERSVYYAGCGDARAAGAAPIFRGQPGYREEMDGDDDGIACEPRRGMR